MFQEVSGRVIKVSYANSLKPPPPPGPRTGETGHKLYVGNLAWKVRATNLREFVEAQNFKPVSTRIVFEGAGGSPSGYGFISFATKEEADAALVSLDGKVTIQNFNSIFDFFFDPFFVVENVQFFIVRCIIFVGIPIGHEHLCKMEPSADH